MVASFLTTIFFSISAVCGQRAARLLGGTAANFWRLALGTLVLALYAHTWGGGVRGAAFPVFLLSGFVGFGIGDIAFYQALPRLGSRLSVLLVLCLSSPLGGWIEWWWLGAALTPTEILCGLVILAGVTLALSPGQHLPIARGQLLPGLGFGLLASLCHAGGAVLSRKGFAVAQGAGESLDGMTAAYQRILGGVFIAALAMFLARRGARTSSPSAGAPLEKPPRAWAWVVLNALSGSVVGVSCFQWALRTTPTGVVLPIIAITPLVIIPFSRYIEGEQPTWRSLAGGVIAVGGAVALSLSR